MQMRCVTAYSNNIKSALKNMIHCRKLLESSAVSISTQCTHNSRFNSFGLQSRLDVEIHSSVTNVCCSDVAGVWKTGSIPQIHRHKCVNYSYPSALIPKVVKYEVWPKQRMILKLILFRMKVARCRHNLSRNICRLWEESWSRCDLS